MAGDSGKRKNYTISAVLAKEGVTFKRDVIPEEEQVGALGRSLLTDDKQISTEHGDVTVTFSLEE